MERAYCIHALEKDRLEGKNATYQPYLIMSSALTMVAEMKDRLRSKKLLSRAFLVKLFLNLLTRFIGYKTNTSLWEIGSPWSKTLEECRCLSKE